MANIDINKDSLFSMAKRITKENNFFPKNLFLFFSIIYGK